MDEVEMSKTLQMMLYDFMAWIRPIHFDLLMFCVPSDWKSDGAANRIKDDRNKTVIYLKLTAELDRSKLILSVSMLGELFLPRHLERRIPLFYLFKTGTDSRMRPTTSKDASPLAQVRLKLFSFLIEFVPVLRALAFHWEPYVSTHSTNSNRKC